MCTGWVDGGLTRYNVLTEIVKLQRKSEAQKKADQAWYEEAKKTLEDDNNRPKKKTKVVVECVKAECDPDLDLGPEYEAWYREANGIKKEED
jgi:hypothetical protein